MKFEEKSERLRFQYLWLNFEGDRKILVLKKLSKYPQKILGYRFRRADSKNIAFLVSGRHFRNMYSVWNAIFQKNSKN